jgi:hypothetical protein
MTVELLNYITLFPEKLTWLNFAAFSFFPLVICNDWHGANISNLIIIAFGTV